MFDNAGKKIKTLAKWLFWFTIIGFIVLALEVSVYREPTYSRWGDAEYEYSCDVPLLFEIIALGVGAAFIDSLMLSAYGEMLIHKKTIAENVKLLTEAYITSQRHAQAEAKKAAVDTATAPKAVAPTASIPNANAEKTDVRFDNINVDNLNPDTLHSIKQFVDNALSKEPITVMFGYVNLNFGKLDKEAAEALASIKPFIENTDAVGLKNALTAINEKLV